MEPLKWYRYDFSKDSEYLIVGFGSVRMFDPKMRGKKGFEWDNLLRYKFGYLNFNTLFVGDVRNSWWHTEYSGLDGIGPFTLSKFLDEKIKESKAKKTLFLGVSMGGYGAILFGCLNNATQVMAFSPQTFITKRRRKKTLDAKFYGYNIDESLTDLKDVLTNYDNGKTVYKIWYGNENLSDKKAAKRIENFKNVYIYQINSSKHPVITPVIDNGIFKKELEKFFK
jgi:hypothetical protein